MNDCCQPNSTDCSSGHESSPRTAPCPLDHAVCHQVDYKTVLQHIKSPWLHDMTDQAYYFCSEPDCDAVYFDQKGQVFVTEQLRTPVWQKTNNPDDPVCYCFGVSLKQAANEPALRQFVIEKTRSGLCDCSSRNPSGRCCLKDFPHPDGENKK